MISYSRIIELRKYIISEDLDTDHKLILPSAHVWSTQWKLTKAVIIDQDSIASEEG